MSINTLGDLKASGYRPRSIKDEMRENLVAAIQKDESLFKGILGFGDTVIPDIERAVLSRHNMILLGLRGQAKTRIARLMIELLDEWMPVIAGSELNDDPFAPISRYARETLAEKGDDTPIEWIHRSERYSEKLATPDVSISDLIGDVDPIKAASLKLPYSDERVIHFGLIPRSHRSIFVINELPDLQARIQVALFNILQERDIQIRGFKLRLPLDIEFVFTANPEDYTNRGAIVTPLKDRIESQILTHYAKSVQVAKEITKQEANVLAEQGERIRVPEPVEDLLEQVSFQARESEYIDVKSGVSARLSISAYENLISTAEQRALRNHEDRTVVRLSDFNGIIPAITGKVELVYEGEVEGPAKVARYLIGKAIRKEFTRYFPDPEHFKRNPESSPYFTLISWFRAGNTLDFPVTLRQSNYETLLRETAGLWDVVQTYQPEVDYETQLFFMELILHGLAEFSVLSKQELEAGVQFKDLLSTMFSQEDDEDEEDRWTGTGL